MTNNGSPDPIFETNESTYVLVRLPIHPEILIDDQESEQVTEQVTEQVQKLLSVINQNESTTTELMKMVGIKHRPTFLYNYLQPALDVGLIEMTIPDKPKSSKQKYRLTVKRKQIK